MLNTCINKIEEKLNEMHKQHTFEEIGKKIHFPAPLESLPNGWLTRE